MRFPALPVVFAVIAISLAPAAEDRPTAGRPGPAELIKQMGDESYPVREAATYELWELGEKAKPFLEKAVSSGDPEVAVRSRGLLRKIHLGILPDSPPEVVQLVVLYDKAAADKRQAIIRRLKQLRAYRQVLRIHELERDPETLERIAGEMEGVSIAAARELLASDEPNFSGAREFLEMGRPEPSQLMALADFHRVHGSLEEELKKAGELEGEAGHLWRYALLAAKGDTLGAADEAEAAGLDLIGARLRALEGDPQPWLAMVPVPPQQMVPDALPAYRKAVADIWKNREVPADLLKQLANETVKGNAEERMAAVGVLYALGDAEAGDDALTRLYPLTAFFSYDSSERIGEALKALGLDPDKPDYLSWGKKKFQKVLSDPDDSDEAMAALSTLGWFLEKRGLDEVASEIFTKPLVDLGREDPEIFLAEIGGLFSTYSYNRVVGPVIDAAAEFAGDDQAKWTQVRDSLLGEGLHIEVLWDSLGQLDPEMDRKAMLRLAAELTGFAPDTGKGIDRWWEWGIERVRKGGKVVREEMISLMLGVSALRSDAARFLEIAEIMKGLDMKFGELGSVEESFRENYRGIGGRGFYFSEYEIACLVSAGRWKEVVKIREEMVSLNSADPIRRAYLAGALRKAGDEERASAQDAVIDRLALGDDRAMKWIGVAYANCGDFARAGTWYRRAAIESTGGTSEFMRTVELLLDDAKERGDWKLAASLGEMRLLFELMMGDELEQPWGMLRPRIETEMARALSRLDVNRDRSIRLLEVCHQSAATDGSMADYFFPALRKAGLVKQHDEWFEQSWQSYQQVLKKYPGSHNTRNTAAWTAARANRRLDEAEKEVRMALESMPDQAAYLDTLGEVWFCRQNRDKALEWSTKARLHAPAETALLRQFERFQSGAFPVD